MEWFIYKLVFLVPRFLDLTKPAKAITHIYDNGSAGNDFEKGSHFLFLRHAMSA